MSTGKNREEKFKLGKRTSGGEYIYDAKVKMSEDFTLQIERLEKEKKVNLELEKALSKVKKVLSKYPPTPRQKNLDYSSINTSVLIGLDYNVNHEQMS